MIDTGFVDVDSCSRLRSIFLTGSDGTVVAAAQVWNISDGNGVDSVDHELWELPFPQSLAGIGLVQDVVWFTVDLSEVSIQESIGECY